MKKLISLFSMICIIATIIVCIANIGDTGQMSVLSPSFRGALVSTCSNTPIFSGDMHDVIWGTEAYDTSNIHQPADPIHMIVPAGVTKVRLCYKTSWELSYNGVREAHLFKNDGFSGLSGISTYCTPTTSNPNSQECAIGTCTPVLTTIAGDTYKLVVSQTSGTTLDFNNAFCPYFSMEIIE